MNELEAREVTRRQPATPRESLGFLHHSVQAGLTTPTSVGPGMPDEGRDRTQITGLGNGRRGQVSLSLWTSH